MVRKRVDVVEFLRKSVDLTVYMQATRISPYHFRPLLADFPQSSARKLSSCTPVPADRNSDWRGRACGRAGIESA